ncbi:LysM peptidoglycan-binding domain-containing protein [Streptococcus iniae]|nr:LysM peptidoglycan-binding domain-containing protein [Streptococcus iniae]
MILKMNKKLFLASTFALTMFATGTVQADEMPWTARSVEDIRADLVATADGQTYSIKYGDTLSSIAEAMSIDVNVLAQVNQISNIDLIFPNTKLVMTYDQNKNLARIEIQPAAPTSTQAPQSATVNLETNQVVVDNTAHPLEDVSSQTQVAPETPQAQVAPETSAVDASVSAQPSVTEPVSEVSVEETKATEVAPEAPAEELPAEPTITSEMVATKALGSVSDYGQPSAYQAPVDVPEMTPVTPAPVAQVAPTPSLNTTGLQPQAATYMNEVAGIYGITHFSTYRPGDSQDHGKGLAVDFMVPVSSVLGDQVADYTIANMASRKVSYIIWKQRFYSPYPSIYGPANTWNLMPDRGSVTENHYDHVHVSFNP